MGGMLAAIKFSHVKNPKPGNPAKYAMWDLEDLDGMIRCIMWPEQFAQFGHLVAPDAIVGVRGAIDRRPGAEEVNLIINELMPIDELAKRFTSGAVIRIDEQRHGVEALGTVNEIVRGYPGTKSLRLHLSLGDGTAVHLETNKRIDIVPELRQRVEQVLGPGHFIPVGAPPKPSSNGNGRNGHSRRREPARS
jgi:DNA polymerase-3 subunit alpha